MGDTYCHLRTSRNRYKHLVQTFAYSTKCDAKEDAGPSLVDPKVKALREKLIYCDYLDRQKVTMNYMKRFYLKKKIEYARSQARVDKLTNVPVYSVLLDRRDDESEDDRSQEERLTRSVKPVHMPYASTDEYSSVNATSSSSDSNESNFDEGAIPLSDKYKDLYDRYLEEKKAALGRGKELALKDYMEETDTDPSSYKTDLSNVPPNWMVDVEQYDDTLQDDTWLSNYGTPDPNSSISSVPCGGCGALLHCKDHALPGYLPSELFLGRKERQLRTMICQRCHFMKYYNTTLEVKVSADVYPELLRVIKRKKCAVILMVDLTDFPCSIWPEIKSVLHPATPVFVVGNKIDLLPQDSQHFFAHVKECLSKAVESTGIQKERIRHIALVSAKTGYGVEELINKLHSLWKYKGKQVDSKILLRREKIHILLEIYILIFFRRRLCHWMHKRWQVLAVQCVAAVRLLQGKGCGSHTTRDHLALAGHNFELAEISYFESPQVEALFESVAIEKGTTVQTS